MATSSSAKGHLFLTEVKHCIDSVLYVKQQDELCIVFCTIVLKYRKVRPQGALRSTCLESKAKDGSAKL